MSPSLRPSFWKELRRRRVVRAVSVYAVFAWVAVQVADIFVPALLLPEWTLTLVAVLAVLGFPLTAGFAWIFDKTPEGLQWTEDAGHEAAPHGIQPHSRKRTVGPQFYWALGLGAVAGMLVVGAVLWLANALRGPAPSEPGIPDPGGAGVIAVLPFETVGEANSIFTEGIHGDVLTRLSGMAGLDVISRSSVVQFRDLNRPISEIARELDVNWVLTGEVQQVGGEVLVQARLVDARRDRQEWAAAFQRELTAANLFDIQRDITREIYQALEGRLALEPAADSRRGRTDDLEAYRLYVQGRRLLVPRTEESMRRAVEVFQEAVQRDSAYAPAWAGLADALVYLETFGFTVGSGTVSARTAAVRALELEPELAEAHFALANLAHAERDNPEAIRRLHRAIELRPSYSDAFNLLSWIEKLEGQYQEASGHAVRAVELDPLGSAPVSNLSLAYLAGGDAEGAVREARRIRDLAPDFYDTTGRFLEGLGLYHMGSFGEAGSVLDGVRVAWAGEGPLAVYALAAVAGGNAPEARAGLAAIDPVAHPFSHALVETALGRGPDLAGVLLEMETWEYWPTLAVRYLFPELLGGVRDDPRHQEILRRIEKSWGSEPGSGDSS